MRPTSLAARCILGPEDASSSRVAAASDDDSDDGFWDNLSPSLLDKSTSGLVKIGREKENVAHHPPVPSAPASQHSHKGNPAAAALKFARSCRSSSRGSGVRQSVTPVAGTPPFHTQQGTSNGASVRQQRQAQVLDSEANPPPDRAPLKPRPSPLPPVQPPAPASSGQQPSAAHLLEGLCAEDVFGDLTDSDGDQKEAEGVLHHPHRSQHVPEQPLDDSLWGLDPADFPSSFDASQPASPPRQGGALLRSADGREVVELHYNPILRNTQTLTQMLHPRRPPKVDDGSAGRDTRARIPSPPPGLAGTALYDWYAQFARAEGHACSITDLPPERQRVYTEQFKITERQAPQAGAASLGPFGRKGLIKTWLGGDTEPSFDAVLHEPARARAPARQQKATTTAARGQGRGRGRGGRGRGRSMRVYTAKDDGPLDVHQRAHNYRQWRQWRGGRGGNTGSQ